MTQLSFTNPPGLYDPRPNGYSHVVVAEAPARLIYVDGQGGENVDGVLSEDFGTQVKQALGNLQTALNATGAGLANVATLTVLIVDHSEERLHIFGRALSEVWGDNPAPSLGRQLTFACESGPN